MSKYWAIFRTQLANNLAYLGDVAMRSVAILLFMWIFAQLWRTTYRAMGVTEMAGLTVRDTLWYLLLAEVIVLSKPNLARSIAQNVRDGSVAYLLNKPYNFVLYQFSVGMGDSVLSLGFNALLGGLLVWRLVGPPPNLWGWPLVLVSMLLAWGIDFCITVLIGLAAFVTEEVRAFEWIYQKMLFILGGLLIPLDFYPDWLQNAARVLPFAYTVYGPAHLFVKPELTGFLTLMAGQLFWLGLLASVVALVYTRSMRWLAINGG